MFDEMVDALGLNLYEAAVEVVVTLKGVVDTPLHFHGELLFGYLAVVFLKFDAVSFDIGKSVPQLCSCAHLYAQIIHQI